ncbi:unnamed protein product [Parajaminaea phylloscopi]
MGLLTHLGEVDPKSRSWLHLWWPAWTIGALGVARGLDEGIISGVITQESFKHAFSVEEDSAMENDIASMLQAGCVVGSVIAFIVSDYLGRRRSAQLACILWALGTVVWFTSIRGQVNGTGNISQLLGGRFIAGLGVGITPVCSPTYLTEIAPRPLRGLAVCIFAGIVYVGIVLGYWVNYGTARNFDPTNALQWQLPAALNFIFAAIIFTSSFFVPESPRWLLMVGREDAARKSLIWLRNKGPDDAVVLREFEEMTDSLALEREARGNRAWYHVLLQLVVQRRNLHILAIGTGIQIFGQFSGGASMTVFAPKLFGYVGISSSDSKLLTTGIFGIVKLASSMAAAFFIVDLLGRKCAVMIGLTIQGVCALYLSIYMRYHGEGAGEGEAPASKAMADAGIFFIFLSGFAWAIGVNSVQYLSQTEMFSLEVRSVGVAAISVLHFLCQFGSSRTVNPLVNLGGPFALFLFFFIFTIIALVFVFFMMPEVSGYPLERVRELFESKPWYLVGCTQNRPFRIKDGQNVAVRNADGDNEAAVMPGLDRDRSSGSGSSNESLNDKAPATKTQTTG